MVSLEKLSKIGFGGYRISKFSNEHLQALEHAIDLGCNLIDTSSNYVNGESELLIGEVVSKLKKQVFIVTKAGYINSQNENINQVAERINISKEDIVQTHEGTFHSICPEFLETEIETSLNRLKSTHLDGFLLHNPEYYFDQICSLNPQVYYSRIKIAFEFLEAKVMQGKIRYYGISSNTLSIPHNHNATDLLKIIEIADNISKQNHFKLIQLPFNLIENDAIQLNYENNSLIDLAKINKLVTLSNRPLNAIVQNRSVRFANYDTELENLNEKEDYQIIEFFLDLIKYRLSELDIEEDVMSFIPIQVIATCWSDFPNTETVDGIFYKRLNPFLLRIYEGNIPSPVLQSLSNLKTILMLYAKKNMAKETNFYTDELRHKGIIEKDDTRQLSDVAIKFCLESGINHVLVGMRKKKYVDSCKKFFE